jgi:hypothetical protein
MLLHDSRYLAEEWLGAHVEKSAKIGAYSTPQYLPRLAWLGYSVEPFADKEVGAAALAEGSPDYLLLSSLYYPHFRRKQRDWIERLLSGSEGYRVMWKDRGHSPLEGWMGHRYASADINPEIVILERNAPE